MALDTFADIINAACARIGEQPVQDFDDDLGGGQSALLIYEEVVDFNLGLQPAGFAFGREVRQLSLISGLTPFTGYDYVFDVPGPYTGTPVFLTDDPTDPHRRYTDFLLTAGRVHAQDNPLYAMVKFRPDPHRWTATFRSATITSIAAHLAYAIASKASDRDDLLRIAYGNATDNFRGGQMRAALFEDGFSNPPRPMAMDNNPLTNSWRS